MDVGTSGVRGAVVLPDATVTAVSYREVLPSTPAPGLVEFDAVAMADAALEVAAAALAEGGPVAAVGIANQRASTVVWDRASGEPVGPGIGWQDLRTVGACLVLQAEGLKLAPNQSATKYAQLLDDADPDRTRDLCVGTVDTWIAWHLSGGTVHATDLSNAAVTGLIDSDHVDWDDAVLEKLRIPRAALPAIVDSTGLFGEARALEGSPPLAALVGDQQASLVGQGCVRPGDTKITFGTGAMLDMCLGPGDPPFTGRNKGIIEDHFDRMYELDATLSARGKKAEMEILARDQPEAGAMSFTRQQAPLGLGHAVWCARDIVGNEPFAVILPDELVLNTPGCLKQMIEAASKLGDKSNLIAVEEVPAHLTHQYGICGVGKRHTHGNMFEVDGMVEKPPKGTAPSNLSITGRYILQPEIFKILETLEHGAGGEIQLTDAMIGLQKTQSFYGVEFEGERHDCGSKAGFLRANIAFGMARADLREDLRAVMQKYLEK